MLEFDEEPAIDAAPGLGELLEATRPFAKDDPSRSWLHLVVALALAAGLSIASGFGPFAAWTWPLRLAGSILAGLAIVRVFIIYHDHMHGTILRDSWAAAAALRVFGLLVLTPSKVWRDTHRYHHAHTAKIAGSHIGSFEMATVEMWREMSPRERLRYRVARHPLTILFGYVSVFLLGMCILPLIRAPRKNWEAALAIAAHFALAALLAASFGPAIAILSFLVPAFVAMAVGSYLFYAQHNAPDVHVQGGARWDFATAALESSSYLKMGAVMAWFTGNIGYHHVHHLNSRIPFYRLPEAMAAIPALQDPPVTTLALADIAATFRLKLWDEDRQRLVGFPHD